MTADLLRTRIDRQGRLYVPKRAGAVSARWSRRGDSVEIVLSDRPGGVYRRYIQLLPGQLLAASLRGRWRCVRLGLERVHGGWLGRYKLLKEGGNAEGGGRGEGPKGGRQD